MEDITRAKKLIPSVFKRTHLIPDFTEQNDTRIRYMYMPVYGIDSYAEWLIKSSIQKIVHELQRAVAFKTIDTYSVSSI